MRLDYTMGWIGWVGTMAFCFFSLGFVWVFGLHCIYNGLDGLFGFELSF